MLRRVILMAGIALTTAPGPALAVEPTSLWARCRVALVQVVRKVFGRAEPPSPAQPRVANPITEGVSVPTWKPGQEVAAITWGIHRLTALRQRGTPVSPWDLMAYVDDLSLRGVATLASTRANAMAGPVVTVEQIRQGALATSFGIPASSIAGHSKNRILTIPISDLPTPDPSWTPEMRAALIQLADHQLNLVTEEFAHHVQALGGSLGSRAYAKYLREHPAQRDHETEVAAYLLENLGFDRTRFYWGYYPGREHYLRWVQQNTPDLIAEGLLPPSASSWFH